MATLPRLEPWGGFRSVLCGVDFSEPSRLALRYAAAIAVHGRARLTVTYANDPLLVAAAGAALHNRDIAQRSAGELRAFVDASLAPQILKRLGIGLRVSTGSPVGEILSAASREHSDLIVLGTEGLTGASRLFVGSTTLSVLRRTTVPVLAIPHGAKRFRGRLLWPGGRVVAALELDRTSRREAAAAARVARWLGRPLLLLHVVPGAAVPAWLAAHVRQKTLTRVTDARRKLDALATPLRGDVETDIRVVRGTTADEIARLAAADRPTLIMTTLRAGEGWMGARRGTVSYGVLAHAVAPVLAVPSQWEPR